MIEALKEMGYENYQVGDTRFNIASQVHDPETNTDILMNPSPYMFDGTIMKVGPALAKKALDNMDGDRKIIIADEQKLKRNQENAIRYLNSIGIDTIAKAEEQPQQSEESTPPVSQEWKKYVCLDHNFVVL